MISPFGFDLRTLEVFIQQLHHVRIALVDSLANAVGRPLIDAVRRRTEDWSISTGLSHMHAQALL